LVNRTPPQARDDDPALFSGHPRTAGTHSKTLRLAREEGVPLNFTLAQLSYWSALHLGDAGIDFMKERGRMQESMAADVVIFDPENVAERTTYKAGENGLPPVGMPHVIVNGVFVKREDKGDRRVAGTTDSLPGRRQRPARARDDRAVAQDLQHRRQHYWTWQRLIGML
jgi:N-acyl-D-aspartate/D-glutamate deacylase